MSIVDTFKVSEVDKFRKIRESGLGVSFLQGNSVEATKEKLQTISPDLEAIRPFVGEYLWNLLNCYRTIHLRMYFILQMLSDDPAEVIGWFTDKGTYGIVAAVLDEKELEYFDKLQFGKFTWLIDKLESKMLTELRNIVSGQHFAQDALEKIDDAAIKRMKQAVASTQTDARAT